MLFNQSHPNGKKIHVWKPKAYSNNIWPKKIKKYSHFQTITINNRRYVSDFISNNIDTFMELLPNNTTHFLNIKQYWHFHRVTGRQYCGVYIKQYWHFQKVPSKLNYSKNFFQSIYHTIMTLSQSYYQTILAYSQLISNSIYISTELLPNNSKHYLEIWNGHLNKLKILKWDTLN